MHTNSNLVQFCSVAKHLEMFQEANKQLDQVSRGLTNYLDMKRLAFSRFFFLSNDELLQILAQTNDPQSVQVRYLLSNFAVAFLGRILSNRISRENN